MDAINENIDYWKTKVDFDCIDDDRSLSKAKALAKGHDLGFETYFDKNQDLKCALGVNIISQTFVFDKNGKIIYLYRGFSLIGTGGF